MPEWPEVENWRKMLNERVCGWHITAVTVQRASAVNEPEETFSRELAGRQIAIVERRGRNLVFHLDDGNRLLLRPAAGTRLYIGQEAPAKEQDFQVILGFENGTRLFFGGLKPGSLNRLTAKQVLEELKALGPEPLDARLTPEVFRERLAARRGKLKNALTGQQVVAGIGPRYGDEICFAACVHPETPVSRLSAEDIGRLYDAMRQVLTEAADKGGFPDKPLFDNDPHSGGYYEARKVFEREGEPCAVCGTKIEKGEASGRKTYFCPHCQRKD